MGSNKLNISNQILQSVDILVNKRISQLNFDKTIQATVLECIDAGIGKYKLSYQNSIIYAYSDNILQIYPDNTEVYVSIPQNDLDSEHKLITGLVQKDGSIAVGAIKEQDSYYPIGTDLIFDEGEFGLCSYKSPDSIILYSVDGNHNLISVDDKSAEIYFKDHNYMMFGAEFRTALDEVQRETTGNYGFKITMQFCKNSYNRKDNEPVPASEIVAREYDFSSLSIPGQSNKLVVPRKASLIREVDGNNFIRIREISIYCKGYQHDQGEHPNDIFISNFQLFSIQPLTEAQKNANTLKIIIDESQRKKGYFDLDNNNVFLKAILKSKTKTVKDTEKVKFYWYLKNNKITSDSPQYNTWGGANWQCLNSFEEDENGKRLWAPSGETFELINTFNNNIYKFPSPINIIRCVALLGREDNQQRLVDEIAVRNEYNNYRVEITSTNGQDFYFDKGQTTLQAKLIYKNPKGGEQDVTNSHKCRWGYEDSAGAYYSINQSPSNPSPDPYNYRHQKVDDIPNIVSYRIYSCAFYTNDSDFTYLGQNTIKISNIYQNQQQDYNLVLKNGNKVYKYDMNGVSPAAAYIPNPIAIDPVTFSLFDKQGTEISFEQIQSAGGTIEWRYPVTDTMIKVEYSQSDTYEDPNDSNYRILTGTRSFQYSIQDTYEYSKGNNNITLTVKYKDSFCPAYATFAFIKDGALGTNGTAYYCSIAPADKQVKQVRIVKKGNNIPYLDGLTTVSINGSSVTAALVARLIKNGDVNSPIVEAYNGQSMNNVRWYIPNVNQGDSAFSITENGAINPIDTIEKPIEQSKNNVVRVEINNNNIKHYTEYSIPVVLLPQGAGEKTMLSLEGGFSYVQYESDGRNPKYNHAPFRAVLKIDGEEVEGQEYRWQNLTRQTLTVIPSEDHKTFSCQPNITYESMYPNAAIKLEVKYHDEWYVLIHSIQYYLDRYGKGYINDWDGNSVKIDEDNGYILAPQIGAGKLNDDHSFTGITIGQSFDKKESKEVQTGVMGYYRGARSIFLDAQTGKASFGVSGQGQIVLDPENGQGVIRSGNYTDKDTRFSYTYQLYFDLTLELDENGDPKYDSKGNPIYTVYPDPLSQNHYAVRGYKIINQVQEVLRVIDKQGNTAWVPAEGVGMSINLTEPSIKAGAGQFQLTSKGKLITRTGEIAGWHMVKGLPFNENNLVDTSGMVMPPPSKTETSDSRDYPTGTISSDKVNGKEIKILSSENNFEAGDTVSSSSGKQKGTTLQSDGSLYCKKLIARDSGVIGGWRIGNQKNISAMFYNYKYDEESLGVTQASSSLLTSQPEDPQSTSSFVCLDARKGIYQLHPRYEEDENGAKHYYNDGTYQADWALLDDGTCIFKKGYIAGWEINKHYLLADTEYSDFGGRETEDIDEELLTEFTPQKNTKASKEAFLQQCGSSYHMTKDSLLAGGVKAKDVTMKCIVDASLKGRREIKLSKDGTFSNEIESNLEIEDQQITGQLIIEITYPNGNKSYKYQTVDSEHLEKLDNYKSSKITTLWKLTPGGTATFQKLNAYTGTLGGDRGIKISNGKYGELVAGNGDTSLKGNGWLVTNKLSATGGQIANWTIDDDSLRDGTLSGTLNGSQIQEYELNNPATHQFGLDKMKITNKLVLGRSATIIDSSQDPETSIQMQFLELPQQKVVNFVASQLLLNGHPIGGVNMVTAQITLQDLQDSEHWDANNEYTVYITDTDIGSLRPSDVVFYYPQPRDFEAYVSNRIYVIRQLSDSLVFKRTSHTSAGDIDVCIAVFKS